MTLIKDLISIPTQVQEGDFVLKLTQGVDPHNAAQTVKDYEVTPQLAKAFDEALGLIASSVTDRRSRAVYLHGSFGSGKSHFMAILHLLLKGNTDARSLSELHAPINKHDDRLQGKRYLLVPLHFLAAKSMESTILGGYLDVVSRAHPDHGLPPVFLSDQILEAELPELREMLGDQRFLEELNRAAGGDDEWGEFGTVWTVETVDRAMGSTADVDLRSELAAAYIGAFRAGTLSEVRNVGEGFINLDDGLAAISERARSLGYDAVVLFLDELILWLASNIGNVDMVIGEVQKLTKLVESTNADRPAPLISFVARQRDLRELVSSDTTGDRLRVLWDSLELQKGRFGIITLEDRNLPIIAKRRLLAPVSDEAAGQLLRAVDEALAGKDDIRQMLMTSDSDLEMFRTVYPFSPALVQALVAVSEALQRERTALKVMLQLLVDKRETLSLGQLIPAGDLWDVVTEREEPMSAELGAKLATARRLYRIKLRPMLLGQHGLTDDLPPSDPRWTAFAGDDRIIKTLLLAGLVDLIDAFRNLDAARLVALNWGSVTAPIAGFETQTLVAKLRQWSALTGEIVVGDDPVNPSVAVQLVNVDTEDIIKRAAEEFDSPGSRRQALRRLLLADLGESFGEGLFTQYRLLWRGTDREIDVLFGNLRDTSEISDTAIRSAGEKPKLIIDFPFDDQGRSPEEDLTRLDDFAQRHGATHTVAWVPSFLNAQGLTQLKTFVAIDELLRGDRYEKHTSHLSQSQRLEARPILETRRNQLREQLKGAILSAYGVTAPGHALVDPGNSLDQHFRSMHAAMPVRPTTSPSMRGALDELCDQMLKALYPGHPDFAEKVTPAQRKTTWATVQRALGHEDWRVLVEQKDRPALRNVANTLELGTMHESHFKLERSWLNRLDKHLAKAKTEGRHVDVAELRAHINSDGSERGLPHEIADLVVLTVAAQTDHAIKHSGLTLKPDGGSALPSEAVLVPEVLPNESDWKLATHRAAALFGINASPMVSAPEVASLADDVKQKAGVLSHPAADLVTQLESALRRVGGDLEGNRMRNARAGRDLVSAIRQADSAHEMVNVLARAEVPTSETALGTSLTRAAGVTAALSDTLWDLLQKAGPEVMEPLRRLLGDDELVASYDETRKTLQRRAVELMGTPIGERGRVAETPPRGGDSRVVGSVQELDSVVSEIRRVIDEDGAVRISWEPENT